MSNSERTEQDVAAALNRVADALFTQAKAQKAGVRAQEGLLAIQHELLALQKQNINTTRALEQALLMQQEGSN